MKASFKIIFDFHFYSDIESQMHTDVCPKTVHVVDLDVSNSKGTIKGKGSYFHFELSVEWSYGCNGDGKSSANEC